MTNDEASSDRPFDLEERTSRFGEAVIEFARSICRDPVTEPLVKQFVRSATSIGANYCEVDDAGTKKEFRYRISVAVRESRESKFWCRMIAKACPDQAENARELWKEADELNRIFKSIFRKSG